MNKLFIHLCIVVWFSIVPVYSQTGMTAGVIAFYNVENLFDTINSPGINDEEFTPQSPKKWNTRRYYEKLDNIARVISEIGRDEGLPGGPHILGLSEIENFQVIEELVNHRLLAHLNYRIIHYNSFDIRGIDVAMIYQPDFFTVKSSKSYVLPLTSPEGEEYYSRSQLVVSGLLMGEKMHFIVNHWPSRRSGSKASQRLRVEAARLTRHIVDSLQSNDPEAKIIVMGDLNDDPTDISVTKHLRAKGTQTGLEPGDLYNPMYMIYRKGSGSLAYRDKWNLFDQIIISQPLLGKDFSSFQYLSATVYAKDYMAQNDGRFKGYPLRTFVGNQYTAGYSDHFPVYIILARKK